MMLGYHLGIYKKHVRLSANVTIPSRVSFPATTTHTLPPKRAISAWGTWGRVITGSGMDAISNPRLVDGARVIIAGDGVRCTTLASSSPCGVGAPISDQNHGRTCPIATRIGILVAHKKGRSCRTGAAVEDQLLSPQLRRGARSTESNFAE